MRKTLLGLIILTFGIQLLSCNSSNNTLSQFSKRKYLKKYKPSKRVKNDATEQKEESRSLFASKETKPEYFVLDEIEAVDNSKSIQLNEQHLNQIKKILKPNGLLLIALPNRESYDAKKYKEYWAAWDIPIHLWHFSPNNIRDLLKKYKLKLHKEQALPFDAFYVSILSSKAKKSSMPLIMGGWNGLISFVKGLFKVEKNSSLIYFFKHQQ